jgi:hypothetical protein
MFSSTGLVKEHQAHAVDEVVVGADSCGTIYHEPPRAGSFLAADRKSKVKA